MNDLIHIRKAALTDLDGIIALETISFKEDGFVRRQFSYLISRAKGVFYVVESMKCKCIIGYISLLQRSGSANLRIYSIAVHPDFRGRQIGQKLFDKSKEYAKANGFQQISLEVKASNVVAMKFYLKNGFKVQHVIGKYYSDGSDAFKMYVLL